VSEKLLAPWPIHRPRGWTALVNEPLAGENLSRVKLSFERGRPLGSDPWSVLHFYPEGNNASGAKRPEQIDMASLAQTFEHLTSLPKFQAGKCKEGHSTLLTLPNDAGADKSSHRLPAELLCKADYFAPAATGETEAAGVCRSSPFPQGAPASETRTPRGTNARRQRRRLHKRGPGSVGTFTRRRSVSMCLVFRAQFARGLLCLL
jgi:hypothetical protein